MKDYTHDIPGVITRPPFIYAGALVVGLLLHRAFPVSVWPDSTRILGWLLIGIATLLVAWAYRVMRRAGTSENPYQPTTALVTEGPYRFTRNPMYLSLTLLYTGIGVLVNALWVLCLLPAVLVVMRYGVIEREERYLERKFGEKYLQYKARVRRWYPSFTVSSSERGARK
jgi:protein-S-isoprenylcysteine O-methyltransferase Ste14